MLSCRINIQIYTQIILTHREVQHFVGYSRNGWHSPGDSGDNKTSGKTSHISSEQMLLICNQIFKICIIVLKAAPSGTSVRKSPAEEREDTMTPAVHCHGNADKSAL